MFNGYRSIELHTIMCLSIQLEIEGEGFFVDTSSGRCRIGCSKSVMLCAHGLPNGYHPLIVSPLQGLSSAPPSALFSPPQLSSKSLVSIWTYPCLLLGCDHALAAKLAAVDFGSELGGTTTGRADAKAMATEPSLLLLLTVPWYDMEPWCESSTTKTLVL